MKNTIILSTGSNLGNKVEHLTFALKAIKKELGQIQKVSSIYKSDAWGNRAQDFFLNQAIMATTNYSAIECLDIIQAIEQQRLRKREQHWGARTLDIDIVYFNQEIIENKRLIIPHPYLAQRKFVLVPLCEICPEYLHPVLQKNNKMLLQACEDHLGVKIYNEI